MKNLKEKVQKFDDIMVSKAQCWSLPLARFAIFLVYFWFGILKVFGTSPASPLVIALLEKTMPFFAPDTFLICFGLLEMFIGILFITPKMERIALIALALHLITTIMPLVLLPNLAWQGFFIPTLEGQYIIKNILLISAGMVILANLNPLRDKNIC